MHTDSSAGFVITRVNSWAEKLPTYRVASFLFLRALGFVYFCAFVSLWLQVDGLIGRDGILPIASLMERASGQVGFRDLPTLCWLNAGDGFLHAQCALGTLFSLLLMAGLLPALCAPLLWLLYLSLTVAGQQFLSFQWDVLLLETGFLGIWLTPFVLRSRLATDPPPSRISLLLVQLLLFKLMFLSGYVKLRSNDEAWWNLTALTYHYWTQCLPTWPAWYFDKLPLWFQKFSCGLMFAIEFILPFLIWGPGRIVRWTAFIGLAGFQVLIAITGNYTFFNVLTAALCVVILDDRCFDCSHGSASRERASQKRDYMRWPGWVVGPIAIPILIVSFQVFSGTLGWRVPWPRWTMALHEYVGPFRTVNGYGLFAVMTKTRLEIIVEGSDDGVTWLPYEFRWKPGDPARRPGFVAPHQPRLDWQMWFAALSDYRHQPWLMQFLARLLEGAPPVLDLLEANPFPDQPPRYLRASAYDYHFSTWEERRRDGTWWTREPRGLYCPVISLRKNDS
jgi:hypothetical protein